MSVNGTKSRPKSASRVDFNDKPRTLTLPDMRLDQSTRIATQAATLTRMAMGEDSEELQAEYFDPGVDCVFLTISGLRAQGYKPDTSNITNGLRATGFQFECDNLGERVAGLITYPTNTDIDYYASEVKRQYTMRQRKETLYRLANSVGSMSEEDFHSQIAELQQQDEQTQSIEFLSGPELAAKDCRIEWLVKDLLVKAQPTLQGAPRKAYKTTTSIDLIISLATGTPFLGHFEVTRPVRAALMSAESGAGTIKETANRIAVAKGFTGGVRDCPNALFAFDTPMVSDEHDCQVFHRIIERNKLEFLGIDPTYLTFMIGDQGKNLFSMGRLLAPLSRIMQQTGCTIMLSHHAVKKAGKDGQPLELGDEAYAGFSEWARQWMYLSRREPPSLTNIGSAKLWMSYGGSAGHTGVVGLDIEEGKRSDPCGRIWRVAVRPAQEIIAEGVDSKERLKNERAEQTFQRNLDKAREALKQFPNGETKRELAPAARLSPTKFNECLYELQRLNEIVECTIEKGGQTHQAWRSATGATECDNECDKNTESG